MQLDSHNLNDLMHFAQVVEHGGFSAAERVLGISKSRLSRRVAELEAAVGVRLLQRSTRKLALTEACSNSVRHAYRDGDGRVEIVYELEPDRLAIEVTDDGAGFEAQRPLGDHDELSEGGLGIAIIRAIADELELGPKPDGPGSRLRFVKLLSE